MYIYIYKRKNPWYDMIFSIQFKGFFFKGDPPDPAGTLLGRPGRNLLSSCTSSSKPASLCEWIIMDGYMDN